jgi:hypothetical protein
MGINAYEKGLIHQNLSAVAYEALTFTNGVYTPTLNSIFAGLYIAPGTPQGTVAIEGADATIHTLTLDAGLWPLGGQGIIEDGTTIPTSAITVLF